MSEFVKFASRFKRKMFVTRHVLPSARSDVFSARASACCRCLRCINHTHGESCQFCNHGYVGDPAARKLGKPPCQPCSVCMMLYMRPCLCCLFLCGICKMTKLHVLLGVCLTKMQSAPASHARHRFLFFSSCCVFLLLLKL